MEQYLEQYTALAEYYDRLTGDVDYEQAADRLDKLFQKNKKPVHLVLDLACGTGTMTRLLSQRGYELISADASHEMLAVAREKCRDLPVPPVFIGQSMEELDLYGTIDAAVCTLDSINYLTDLRQLRRAVSLVSLFLEPGGLFVFDVKSPAAFAALAGTVSCQEEPEFDSIWQYGYDPRSRLACHTVTFYIREGERYRKEQEEHFQRAWSIPQLEDVVQRAGLKLKGIYKGYTTKKAAEDDFRLLFVTEKR